MWSACEEIERARETGEGSTAWKGLAQRKGHQGLLEGDRPTKDLGYIKTWGHHLLAFTFFKSFNFSHKRICPRTPYMKLINDEVT